MRTLSHQFPSGKDSSERNSAVPSTWPCTICPLSRSPTAAARSRLTREPTRNIPRLLRDRVSGDRSHQNPFGSTVTAVRQTPLTAMLAPAFVSSSTVLHSNFIRLPATAIVPSSSTIPVNTLFLHVGFDGEFIRRNAVQL